jgi:pilus assembly protein CpaB
MLRKGTLLFMALAIVLAAAAAYGAHQYIVRQGQVAASTKVVMAPVVVAARDLPAGRALTAADLSVAKWPQMGRPAGAFGSVKQIDGRVLKTPASQGEPLLPGKLAAQGLAGGLSSVVPPGFRAMTVRVDEVIGVGGFVQPGDHVDVLVTVSLGPYREDPVTRIVLQDVKVLTVGEKVEEEKGRGAKKDKFTVVTLQLTPDQGETLALAASEGKLLLGLRNRSDKMEKATAGVRLTSILPPPVQPPAQGSSTDVEVEEEDKRPTVEIIKGTQLVQQTM